MSEISIKQLLVQLRNLRNEQNLIGMSKFGISTKNVLQELSSDRIRNSFYRTYKMI